MKALYVINGFQLVKLNFVVIILKKKKKIVIIKKKKLRCFHPTNLYFVESINNTYEKKKYLL